MELQNLKYELDRLGKDSVDFLKNILLRNGKVASGDLINSISYEVIQESNGFILRILANDTFTYVDEGRRPGKMPPVKPIVSWIKQKKIKFGNLSDNSMGFIIARSIGEKGIKPMRLKKQLLDDFLTNKDKLLLAATEKDVEKALEQLFS
jgi:hypothetical protein